MKRAAITLGLLFLAGCGGFIASFGGGANAFSNLFPDNQQADVASALAKQPAPSVAKAPRNATGRPLIIATTYGKNRKLVALDPSKSAKVWEVAIQGSSRPVIGDTAVLITIDKALVAYDVQTGAERWRMDPPEGLSYIGSAVEAGTAYVVFGIPGGARVAHVCALDLANGSRRWSHDVDKPLGTPAVRGGVVFVPWDRQNLTLLDATTGDEIARLRSTDDVVNFVTARPEGVFYGSKSLYRFTRQSFRGTKADSAHYVANVGESEIPGNPEFFYDAFAQPTGGRNAREKIRFHWQPDVSQPDAVSLSNGSLYLLYYRFVFAFDAASGALKWVYRHPIDTEGLQVTSAGVFLVADNGDVVQLRAADGVPVWKWASGVEFGAVTMDLDGFAPQPNEAAVEVPPLRARLLEVILDPDNRLVPIRSFAVRLLAKMEEPEITRDLLDVYAQRNTPEGLKQVTAMALRERRTGASFLVEALRRHYDYLEQTEAYPLTVLAPTLVAMGERSAVPGLLEHLNDHETSVAALKEVVAAINALGDAATIPSLREFLVKYHSDSSFRADPTPLILAAEGLLRMGDVAERELLAKLAAEPSVLSGLGTKVSEMLAAYQAEQTRLAEEAERARLEQERAAQQAAAGPAAAQRVVPRYLSQEEVNATLDAKAEEIRTCTNAELARNARLTTVRVSLVIQSDGTVARTTSAPGSQTLQGCLDTRIRSYRFPTFRDTRMSANYTIRVREVELQAPEVVQGQQQVFRGSWQQPGGGTAAPGGARPPGGSAQPGFPQGWQTPGGGGSAQPGFPQGWQAPASAGGGFPQGWSPPAGSGNTQPGFPQGWSPSGTAAPGTTAQPQPGQPLPGAPLPGAPLPGQPLPGTGSAAPGSAAPTTAAP